MWWSIADMEPAEFGFFVVGIASMSFLNGMVHLYTTCGSPRRRSWRWSAIWPKGLEYLHPVPERSTRHFLSGIMGQHATSTPESREKHIHYHSTRARIGTYRSVRPCPWGNSLQLHDAGGTANHTKNLECQHTLVGTLLRHQRLFQGIIRQLFGLLSAIV